MDELIDIYDENQNLVGSEMKSVAHREGHWHKSIHAYLINSEGEIVIQKRAKDKELYPDIWDVSFAGHVGAGERTSTSAIRECQEELGVCLKENQLSYLFTIPEKLQWGNVVSNEFVDVYLCNKDFNKDSFLRQEEEVDEIKVIPLQEFINMIETKSPDLFPHYEEYGKMLSIFKEIAKNIKVSAGKNKNLEGNDGKGIERNS